MIRVGIIGCGKIAQVRHLPEYAANPNAEIVAFYDKNMERAQEMAAQYGGKVYNSFYELVDDPNVDAVSICVENRSHAEICTAALYAGKHVLVEKPMAVTLAECESMVAAAERNGRHLMVGHNMRFDPVHRKAKQMLDSGIIGDVITFRTILGNSGPEGWSLEGTWFFDKNKAAMGALSDMGIHKVDLIQYLLGQKVIETTAKVVTLNKRDDNGKLISVDDNALCILKMSGGALGTMAASWTVYGHECQSTVLYGTKGLMMIYSEPSAPIIINDLEGNRTSFAFETTSHNSGRHRRVCGRAGPRPGAGGVRQGGSDHHADHLRQHPVLRHRTASGGEHRFCDPYLRQRRTWAGVSPAPFISPERGDRKRKEAAYVSYWH